MIRSALAALLLAAVAVHAHAQSSHVLVVTETVSVRVNADSTSVTDRTETLKALDAYGAKCLSTYMVPYQAVRQDVRVVEASVIEPDQSEVVITQSDIVDQPMGAVANAPAYIDAREVVVHVPKMVPGSVVMVHTIKTEKQPFLPGVFSLFEITARQWPIEDVNYTLTAPASLHLYVQANDLQGGMHTSMGQDSWIFAAHQVPPLVNVASTSEMLKKSPFIAAIGASKVDQVARQYLWRTTPPQHISLELQYIADTVGGGSIDPSVLVRRYYEWINNHVRLVDIPMELGLVKPRRADDILTSGYGTAEDRVILMQALMSAKDVSADLVLVPSLPVMWSLKIPANTAFANRVLLSTDNGQQLLDIGNPVVDFGESGPRDRGKIGTRIAMNGATTDLVIPEMHSTKDASSSVSTAILIDKHGDLSGSSIATSYGDLASDAREAAFGGEALLAQKLARNAPKGTTLTITSYDDPRRPTNAYTITAKFQLDKFQDKKGGFSMPLPRPVTSVPALEDFSLSSGEGLCQRTWRQEVTTIDMTQQHSFSPPADVDVTAAEGAGHYTAVYRLDSSKLTATRTLELNADPISCGREQQSELAKLAKAVRSDLHAQVSVER